ncbi:MAG: metalloregulator ArsR/SmtB family transcription factor [Idiomarina sp.]|nr:metalloregulator ArsR/SmtB family transcription factor [Idiomarina sp.]
MQVITQAKGLADPTRLQLLQLLRQQNRVCVCEFVAALDVSQPKISRHLALLRNAELVEAEREGQWIYYSLASALPDWIEQALEESQNDPALDVTALISRLQGWRQNNMAMNNDCQFAFPRE